MDKRQSLKKKLYNRFGFMIVALVVVVCVGFLFTMVTYNSVTKQLAKSLVSSDTKDAIRALDKLTNFQGPMSARTRTPSPISRRRSTRWAKRLKSSPTASRIRPT